MSTSNQSDLDRLLEKYGSWTKECQQEYSELMREKRYGKPKSLAERWAEDDDPFGVEDGDSDE